MDDFEMTDSTKSFIPVNNNSVKKWFYQNCGESACEVNGNRGRVDPVLKLYPNCPMMYTLNDNVGNGEANGSRVFVNSVRLKTGERSFLLRLQCGTRIQAVFASQVEAIILQHENEDITPPKFECIARKWSFQAKVRINGVPELLKMKANQFPIISNTCATGHKLQGCSLERLLVNDWHYQSN
jgi:hypothetical protein